jgi:23S rRNA (cytosine1962-C5)-methyltransferase
MIDDPKSTDAYLLPPGTPIVHLRSAAYGAFIFKRMIGKTSGNPDDGDLVAVVDKFGKIFGWGFYNSHSQIGLRMFTHDSQKPPDDEISRRIARAASLRRDVLRLHETTDAYRLIHAEGDGLTGLIADLFGEFVVIELFSLAMYRRLQEIQDAIVDAGVRVRNFVTRSDKSVAEAENFRISELRENKDRGTVVITENGVKFGVELSKGHKTGFFCDQRENRLALTKLTPGKRVLDLCTYTGGFAIYAATLGHAAEVTAVDLDEKAIAVAQENARLNDARIEFHHYDAFDFLRSAYRSDKLWDVVVLDPSKFVPRREYMEEGLRKYADLNRLAAGIIAPGGILITCSCSGLVDTPTFTSTVGRAIRSSGRSVQILRVTGAGPDHPVMSDAPESAYLKAVWARLD